MMGWALYSQMNAFVNVWSAMLSCAQPLGTRLGKRGERAFLVKVDYFRRVLSKHGEGTVRRESLNRPS